jgi:DNA transformation protein
MDFAPFVDYANVIDAAVMWLPCLGTTGQFAHWSTSYRRGRVVNSAKRKKMAVSDGFLEFVLEQLSGWGGVTARKMFGGAGLYRDGKMFGLIADDVAYLKVDDSNREQYVQAGSKPFKPYAEKPAVMPYYEIPPDVLEDPEALVEWAAQSHAIPKKAK